MSWLSRLMGLKRQHPLQVVANDKRRLQRVAMDLGCSRALSVAIASVYLKKKSENGS